MARIAGKICQIQADAVAILGITTWTLDIAGDVPDVTGMDSSGARAFIAGLTGWSGNFEAHMDATDAKAIGAGGLRPGATVVIKPFISATQFYTGSTIITGISPKVAVDGDVTWSVTFQGTGALTYPV